MTVGTKITGSNSYASDRWGRIELVQTPEVKVWDGEDATLAEKLSKEKAWHRYSMRKQVRSLPFVSFFNNNGDSSGATYYNNLYGVVDATPMPPILDAQMWAKTVDLFVGHSFNMAISMAEAPESIRLLLDGTRRIGKVVSNLARGNVVKAIQAMSPSVHVRKRTVSYRALPPGGAWKLGGKRRPTASDFTDVRTVTVRKSYDTADLSGLWLELQWGWKPIVQDVFEAFNAFYAQSNRAMHIKVHSSKTNVGHPYIVSNGAWGPYDGSVGGKVYAKKILTLMAVENFTPWQATGLDDPASVVWEKIPFSCVVDWFLPIGDYLKARHFMKTHEGGWYAETDITCVNWTVQGVNMHPFYNFYQGLNLLGTHSKLDYLLVRHAKQPMSQMGRVLAATSLKPLVSIASLNHFVTSMALMRQASR